MAAHKHMPAMPSAGALLVLGLLEQGDKSGCQLACELESRGDRTFEMNEGALYPILYRLEEQGVLRSYEMRGGADRPTRYYKLTRAGVKTLALQREQEKDRAPFGRVVGGEAYDTK